MKIALIFPPQWDPRQPPLCIPTLAGVLKAGKHDVLAWDMNLSLYLNILSRQSHHPARQRLLDQYHNPCMLTDYKRFAKISDKIEDLIDDGYRNSDEHTLYWDLIETSLSEDKSRDWKTAITIPSKFPFYKRIQNNVLEVIQWRPELVTISVNSESQIFGGLSLASCIRSGLPEAKIIMGGQALRSRKPLLAKQDWLFETVDGICISHGEPALEALACGSSLSEVPNILWHDGTGVQSPKELKPVRFSARYSPDFSILEPDKYLSPHTVIPIETARGCDWSRCSFCDHPGLELAREDRYVPRSLDNVLTEVQWHVSQGNTRFFFVDEGIPHDRFRALSEGLAKLEGHLSWICYLRPESTFDTSVFRLARRSGCLKVFIGLETGSERLMRLYRKGTTSDAAKRVILDASEAGIAVHLFLITEFPDALEADHKATDDFLRDVLPSVDAFGFTYDVFPLEAQLGTALCLQPEKFGAVGVDKRTALDMQHEFRLIPKETTDFLSREAHEHRIMDVIRETLGDRRGLHTIESIKSIDDSTHLLLIEGRLSTTRQKR